MSSVFGSKPKKNASDIWAEKQLAKEKADKEALEAKKLKLKAEYAKGLVGPRSLFTKAGGAGFYSED